MPALPLGLSLGEWALSLGGGDLLQERAACVVAVATSLPEVSTSVSAAKLGAFGMAFANIFGGNGFDVGLLFVADVLHHEGPVLAVAEP